MPGLFDPAPPMRVDAWDPNDAFVGSHFEAEAPHDVALFGLPFDGAVTGRRGAREGPDAIRAQLAKLKTWRADAFRATDLGNARMPDEDGFKAGEVAQAAMREALERGMLPIALGGDHSLTYGLVKGVHEARGHVGVLNIDAHLDVRDVQARLTSGTPFGRILDARLTPLRGIAWVGLRRAANSPAYWERARQRGCAMVEATDVTDGRESARYLLRKLAETGAQRVYVSLDLDALDESCAPGVSAPTPDGLDTRRLCALLRELGRDPRVVALDVMEHAPAYDRDAMTARAAAYAIHAFLQGRFGD